MAASNSGVNSRPSPARFFETGFTRFKGLGRWSPLNPVNPVNSVPEPLRGNGPTVRHRIHFVSHKTMGRAVLIPPCGASEGKAHAPRRSRSTRFGPFCHRAHHFGEVGDATFGSVHEAGTALPLFRREITAAHRSQRGHAAARLVFLNGGERVSLHSANVASVRP